jgi:hypothetical protein
VVTSVGGATVWIANTGLVLLALGHSCSPIQDDATGDESQSTEHQAINPIRYLPLPHTGETEPNPHNPAQHGHPPEKSTKRSVAWFVHIISLVRAMHG